MIKFGPSGNSESFYAAGYQHTEQAAKFVKERGLNCFEYSFGRGVRITEAKAIAIGEAFAQEGVEI
ncbi:MAG: endonuclease IV, partial [Clostridia bacterium]|nr:endonuclease IV [Clostridia bacterium]